MFLSDHLCFTSSVGSPMSTVRIHDTALLSTGRIPQKGRRPRRCSVKADKANDRQIMSTLLLLYSSIGYFVKLERGKQI